MKEGLIKIKIIRHITCIALALLLLFSLAYAQSNIRVYVNGMRLNENVIVSEGSTYIPLRAVGEAMGADVAWDGNTNSVFVAFTEEDAIAKIVSDISPSVVTIIGNYDGSGDVHRYNNPTMHGSGVIYKSNGYIVTNAHVVKDIKNLTVVFNDGTTSAGRVLYEDENADLAVVKVDKIGLKPVTMAKSDTVVSGKTAIAVGTPISLSMRNTVTKGIVSGCDVTLTGSYYKLLQTDAAINPGNSGGPLLNSKGELIGINSAKYASAGIDNMGFAIPVDTVEFVLSQFEHYGYVLRPKAQIEFEESWEAKIGLPTWKGITVKTSSDLALVSGDIINTVNGVTVHSVSDWNEAIKDTYNGNPVQIGYTRSGVAYTAQIQ